MSCSACRLSVRTLALADHARSASRALLVDGLSTYPNEWHCGFAPHFRLLELPAEAIARSRAARRSFAVSKVSSIPARAAGSRPVLMKSRVMTRGFSARGAPPCFLTNINHGPPTRMQYGLIAGRFLQIMLPTPSVRKPRPNGLIRTGLLTLWRSHTGLSPPLRWPARQSRSTSYGISESVEGDEQLLRWQSRSPDWTHVCALRSMPFMERNGRA